LAALLVALALFTMARSARRPPAVGPTPPPVPEPAAKAPETPTIAPPAAPTVEAPPEQMPPAVPPPAQTPAIGGGPTGLSNPSTGGIHALALYLASGGASGQKNDFVLEGVTFTTASATLSPEGVTKVDELGALLKSHPNAKIKVVGHTDNAGDSEANRVLSQDRANAVRDELVSQGIAQDRIDTGGAGSDEPIAKNDSPTNMEKNRRIDVIVVTP
jgi:outer membrane protein OmpA-like peptidoglycan-associated protein